MKKSALLILSVLMLVLVQAFIGCNACNMIIPECQHLETTDDGWYPEPDCLNGGVFRKICDNCGLRIEEEFPALWHEFDENNKCIRCGLDMSDLLLETFDINGDGSVICSVYKNGVDGEVKLVFTGAGTIPNYTEENLPPWEKYKENVNLVIIEEGITVIGNNAFSGCANLAKVVLPYSLTELGNGAFNGCTTLSGINFNRISKIGGFAFKGCLSLGSIILSDEFENIEIGEGAFEESGVTEVTIPGKANIGSGAFGGCDFLKAIDFGYCEFIRTDLFGDGCSSLTNVTMSNAKHIESGAFANTGVTHVTLPETLETIGDGAFENCENLESVYVPNGLQSVGNGVFNGCPAIENVYFSGTYAEFEALFENSPVGGNGEDGSASSVQISIVPPTPDLTYFAFDMKEDGTYEVYASGDVAVPANLVLPLFFDNTPVTSVKANGFANTGVKTVLIPDNYTAIGEGAFEGTALTTVYWLGEDADYAQVTVGENNAKLANANVYLYRNEYPYLSETEGNFWYLLESTAKVWTPEDLWLTQFSVMVDTVNGDKPVSNASIELERVNYYKGTFNLTTDEDGLFVTKLPWGDYRYTVRANGVATESGFFTIYALRSDTAKLKNDINLVEIKTVPATAEVLKNGVKGTVRAITGELMPGITVLVREGENTVTGTPVQRFYTNGKGEFTSDTLENGKYTLHFYKETGNEDGSVQEEFVNVTVANNVVNVNVELSVPFVDYDGTKIVNWNGHSYHLVVSKISWSEAKAVAESKGGYLAKIDSAEENAMLVNEFKSVATAFSYYHYFFGATDVAEEGTWRYHDGSIATYTNWVSGQPDNASGNEHYASINLSTGTWNDLRDIASTSYSSDWETNGFIIEIDHETASVGTSWTKALSFGGHIYYCFILNTSFTWTQAAEFCKQNGGYLVSITSQAENDAIYNAFAGYRDGVVSRAWLGMSDAEKEGTWKWESGEPFVYTNWHTRGGQPDNGQGGTEHYGQMYFESGYNGQWNDLPNVAQKYALIMEVGNVDDLASPATTAKAINSVYYNGHTYVMYQASYTWTQAYEFCNNLGGHLATVSSSIEDYNLRKLFSGLGNKAEAWIGLVDLYLLGQGTTGSREWAWITGEPFDFTYWDTIDDEPNNYDGNQWATTMHAYGSWDDGDGAGKPGYFIMEYESIVPPAYDRVFTYNGHTYALLKIGMTWANAKETALALGGHLATITSAGEEDAIEKGLYGVGDMSHLWLGATDCEREGVWHWVTGEAMNFTDWAGGEPNNSGDEDYAHAYFISNQIQYWNDLNGTQSGWVLIEFDYIIE